MSFEDFENIVKVVTSIGTQIQQRLGDFVAGQLNNTGSASDYSTDEHQLPQLLASGSFAGALPDIPDSFQDSLVASLAAPAIGSLWNRSQVVAIKASSTDFSTGEKPCDTTSDIGGPSGLPFSCPDGPDGAGLVLQAYPIIIDNPVHLNDETITDPTSYGVPGFSSLSQFKLDPQDILQSAVATQQSSGLFGAGPSTDDFINGLQSLSPDSITLGQTLVFNMPVCDFSLNPKLTDTQIKSCTDFADSQGLCEFVSDHFLDGDNRGARRLIVC